MAATNPRKLAPVEFEAALAMLALAGMRFNLQTSISALAGQDNTYTVQDNRTRRVMFIHLSSTVTDIRFAYNEAATATGFPVIPQAYMVVDAQAQGTAANPTADVLHFYNTSAGAITVYIVELA